MQVESYNAAYPEKKIRVHPFRVVQESIINTVKILKILGEIKPEIEEDYIVSLEKRLQNEIKDYRVDSSKFSLEATQLDSPVLSKFENLVQLVVQYTCKHLDLPSMYILENKEIETTSLNRLKATERLPYHRVKALTEILGKEEGVSLWKEILNQTLIEERHETDQISKKQKTISAAKASQLNIKYWSDLGLADFTVAILDEHKVLYRFDRCLVPEALKDFNDPDIAYLATCYIGDTPEYNKGRYRKLRRTQTLHHCEFCDELYWDSDVHTNPEQPSLNFIKNLGRTAKD
ncbi:MAG: hypothetical protein ACXACF_06010 [Candidatus Hermodarchaeia archaeon]|jgi:hypothetical protein